MDCHILLFFLTEISMCWWKCKHNFVHNDHIPTYLSWNHGRGTREMWILLAEQTIERENWRIEREKGEIQIESGKFEKGKGEKRI